MGSGSSRPGSRPSRRLRSDRPKRSLSSLLICGACTSHAPNEMEDNPYEVLANSVKHDPVVDKLRSPTKEFALDSGAGNGLTSQWTDTGTSSESSTEDSEGSSFLGSLINAGTSNQGECSSRTEDLVPPDRLNADYWGNDSASTSNEGRLSSDPLSADRRSNMGVVNGVGNRMGKDVSVICADIIHPISSSPQQPGASQPDELSVENYARDLLAIQNSDIGSASVVCNYPVTSDLLRDDSLQESLPPGLGFLVSDRELGRGVGSVLQVDVVSISSIMSSSNSSEISSREARRNSRRLFWDAFSRHSSRRDSDSPAFVFSNDDTDGLGSHDRWLLDFSSDFADDGVGGNSGFLGNRIRSMNEQTLPSRSEGQERLHSGHVRDNSQRSICRSGLHPAGTCSCESILMAEESGSHASISRIVMLAEALFEVLDEIHRQPVSLSLAVVSLPAPEAVVDSFPVRNHRKPLGTESGDDTAQCYICLSEYEEGDEIRVLPCRHEFHTSCVDKWLKEIHGVCPLCRGDVREGLMEESASNSETPSV